MNTFLTSRAYRKATKIFCVAILCGTLSQVSLSNANADFVIGSRVSSISLESTNFGGLEESASTTDLNMTFNQMLNGSTTHEVPGGFINDGIWQITQLSTIANNEITASGITDNTVSGDGAGILVGQSEFEVEFQSFGDMDFVLSGTHAGTTSPGANDAVEITLSMFDGVAFQTMFSTNTGANLNGNSFAGTFQDGETYRFVASSRSFVQGNQTNRSEFNVTLSTSNAVPEPSSAMLIGFMMTGLVCRRTKKRS